MSDNFEKNNNEIKKKVKISDITSAVIVFVIFVTFFKTCSISRRIDYLENKIDKLSEDVNSIKNDGVLNRGDFINYMEIYRLKTLKDALYDQNAIVRTVIRPDDRIHYYDSLIEVYQKKDSGK